MRYNGLSNEEVIRNRRKYGSNKIDSNNNNTFFKLFIESFSNPIIKILLIALLIKIVFLFKDFEWFETLGILIAVFLSTLISTISEYGSESAFKKLQEESQNLSSKVIRNKESKIIPVEDIVVGDLIILNEGDKIPADGIIISGSIYVDESMINGESNEKVKYSVFNDKICEENKVYKGTVVCSKNAYMKVTSVGKNTMYGNISIELQEKSPTSPLKIRLTELAKTISVIGYVGALLGALAYLFSMIFIKNGFDWTLISATLCNVKTMSDYLIYALTLSVTIIVVSVPEGLPMMVTLVLSSNMKKMMKDNVLVRRLVGIETAGNLNYLLTDKTGTLTNGRLEVIDIIDYNNNSYKNICDKNRKIIQDILNYNNESMFSENESIIGGNSTDKALLKFIGKKERKYQIVEKKDFESNTKYSSVMINDAKKVFVKGAPEVIIKKCSKYIDGNGKEKLLYNYKKIENSINDYTKKGIRVIVIAYKKDNMELNNMTYVGFICLKDELRKEAKDGVKLIQNAGINVIMITGDSKKTAEEIAKECGIIKKIDDIILESSELNKYSDEEIKQILPRLKVIARSLPNDKSRLVRLIEEENLVVGMTGDGVNDAPALKKANVGFAMGSGTDVSKEAADIIILDDNILSIGKAILYGRTIFKSIRKFVVYQLTVNICALCVSIIGPLIGIATPITIIQMLWINMIMDTFSGLAFSFEAPDKKTMEEKPKSNNESIMNSYMYSQIVITGFYSAILCIIFLKSKFVYNFIRYDSDNKYLMTAYFALFIFIGIFNAFNARTQRRNLFANLSKNKVFVVLFSFITIVQLYLIYNGGMLFRTYGLTMLELIFIVVLAFSVIPIDILRKSIIKTRNS